ncbi:NLRC4 [Branchiostoma lanceolatum]|uniref:NLRC4 protein n=1 Tax=Branchiostoma lanceolatum TaxID=7740 RepID=A0A8J9YLT5_BRALA|nr:NLRC4 [Branchiostoma lanceolatum]
MAEGQQSNAKDIRQYFFFIKEEVSSDWKDLAFHLDFRRSDTDNIASRNRDDKSRCMDLLEEWLKCNGERATIEALMEALPEANLTSTVDGLKNKYPDVLQNAVKKYYELKLTYFKPLIWNDNFTLTLSDIFTQLELISTDRSKSAPRCILIEGEAGAGKTTFLSKEALDAVSQKTELGRLHDIVLLIRLREVREGETIEEMVWDQCVPETTISIDVQSVKAILQRNESRVLFLLDGHDELRPEARAAGQTIPKLLSGKLYPNSTIVITSRPSAGVQQHTRPDCHIHVMGFPRRHLETYARQYFRLTPMFLLLTCVLWEEDQEMLSTGTMTGLYNNVLICLVRKYCKREGVDMPTDALPTYVADSLMHLGKLALEALLRNKTLIDLFEVERENVNWGLLVKLGVVSLEVSSSKFHPRKQLNFSHKTMQEFLAGRYVAHAVLDQDITELLQLTFIDKAHELRNLLLFTCGCDSQAADAVMEELCTLSKLTPSSLQPLVQGFSHVSMLEELHITENKELGDSGMEVLQVGLSSVPHLTVLRLRMVGMTSVGMSSMVPYMRHLVRLRELDVSDNEIGDSGLESLNTILPILTAMQVLALGFNKITTTAMRTLVRTLRHLTGLIKLDISGNAIGDPGLECLAAILHHLTAMKVLVLMSTGISDRGISALIKALTYLVQLEVLDVCWNVIEDAGLISLVETICSLVRDGNSTLQVLSIGRNIPVTEAGLERIAQLTSTLPSLTTLTRYDRSDRNWDIHEFLSDTAAMSLAEALPKLPHLLMMELTFKAFDMHPAMFRQDVVQDAEEHSTLEALALTEK